VDLDTEEPLPPDQAGILWVAGPTVFPGYLGDNPPDPFKHKDGKRWYVTGDLASVDADGFIHFRGRLKRFLKAGGEMISLPALEEPFTLRYPPGEDGPRVAVEGGETGGGRTIVLFTTGPITLKGAHHRLIEAGVPGGVRGEGGAPAGPDPGARDGQDRLPATAGYNRHPDPGHGVVPSGRDQRPQSPMRDDSAFLAGDRYQPRWPRSARRVRSSRKTMG